MESYSEAKFLPELWSLLINQVKLRTAARLALTSKHWSRQTWILLHKADLREFSDDLFECICVMRILAQRAAPNMRTLHLPELPYDKKTDEGRNLRMRVASEVSCFTNLRKIRLFSGFSGRDVMAMFSPRRTVFDGADCEEADAGGIRIWPEEMTGPLQLECIKFNGSSLPTKAFIWLFLALKNLKSVTFGDVEEEVEVIDALAEYTKIPPQEIFFHYASNGHTNQLETYWKKHKADIQVDKHCQHGLTALQAAAVDRYCECVQLLLAIGADPNIKAIGKEKFTALGFACGYADVMTVQILLQDKRTSMDAATVDIIEEGVLHLATNRVDNLGIVDCLLQQGADPLMVNAEGWSPLHYAAMYGSDPDIVSLVEAGVPVDLRCKVQKNGDGYFTPLQIVETAEAAATLVAHGADLAARDGRGWSVLHEACNEGRDDLVGLILDQMDDAARFVQSVPREQLMPFVDEVPSVVFCAAHNGHASALELVLQIPDFAATLPQTFMGLTAIETAIVTRHYEAVGVLKEYSPDIRLSPEDIEKKLWEFVKKDTKVETCGCFGATPASNHRWICLDCKWGRDSGICSYCALKCHAGHRIHYAFITYGRACDCGLCPHPKAEDARFAVDVKNPPILVFPELDATVEEEEEEEVDGNEAAPSE